MRKKQGILIIADGLGDRPNRALKGMTPLEYAETPNLDKMAGEGMCGNVFPIAPGIGVGTDVGHLEIFGCSSEKYYSGRGPLEAVSAGLELEDGDIAFRGNFATIDKEGIVLDRRAGRINERTGELAASIDGMVLNDGTKVLVKELTEHRVAVVLRGPRMSEKLICSDPGTACEGEKIIVPEALPEGGDQSARTASNLWEFTRKSSEILNRHPVNRERVELGIPPANVILTRGPGSNRPIPSVTMKYGLKAACIAGDQTVGGIARMVGIDYFTDPDYTGAFHTDMGKKARKALELQKSGYDWIVVHIKGTDLAGHDNLPEEKARIISEIDQMMGFLMENIDPGKCYLNLTADHSTPCEARDHTGDGVPTIIWGSDVRSDCVERAGETVFSQGGLSNLTARDIFMLQMDLMGFVPKTGS